MGDGRALNQSIAVAVNIELTRSLTNMVFFLSLAVLGWSVKDLAKIKPPYSDGRSLINPEALTDNNPNTYATQFSPGSHSITWNFRGQYSISLVMFKLENGVTYDSWELLLSNHSTSGYVSVDSDKNYKQDENWKSIFFVPAVKASHIRLRVDPGKGKQTKFYGVEIHGEGEYDEGPTKYDGTRNDTEYTEVVWIENFDGPELNLSRWQPIQNVHFTHHVFTPSQVSIKKDGENSYLALNVKNFSTYENLVDKVGPIDLFPGETINKTALTWASARIQSRDRFAFQHGRAVFRAKCALTRGHWPALWMIAQDERGHDEIDVLEAPQMDAVNAYRCWGTNHYGRWHIDHYSDGGTIDCYEALSENFHIYEVEWDDRSIKFYFDGVMYKETTVAREQYDAMHNRPMYLIIDTHLSRGGETGWAGATYWDLSNQDQDFLVDWVKIYQKPRHNRTWTDPLSKVTPGYQNTDFLVSPVANSGDENFVLLTDGDEQWESHHNFFYDNGMPFDERDRVAVKPGAKDQYLVYHMENLNAVHFSVYYQTVPDINKSAPQDQTPMGVSICDMLVGDANLDFKMYRSETGKDGTWTEVKLERKVNLVYPYPVFSRITFEAYNLPEAAKYIKIVFPNYEGVQYKCGSGKIVDVVNTDIQLSKVVFVTNEGQ